MFSMTEYKHRMNRTKKRMNDEGIEVLLITNPSNMNYLSGYDAWSFYVQQMLIVIIDEEEPIWIGREMDANSAKLTTWMDSTNIISYTDEYVQSDQKHPMQFVANILKEIGQANRKIGVEMENHYFSALSYEKLSNSLPNARIQDASGLVNWVRIIKSSQEILYMKRAAKIVERSMQKAYDMINEGVRECDVAAEIFHTQISGTEEYGGDYPAIVPMLPTGQKTSSPHVTWSDDRFKKGDPVILELAGCYKRYHSPLARTMILGEPPKKLVETADAMIEAFNETLQAIKPGLTCEEVEAIWRKELNRNGYDKNSRLGYSVGLSYPPDWGEHTVSFRSGEKTIIRPNMTFHLIPGIWYEDFGVEISEAIFITDSGCETLANFPRNLFVKE